MRGAEGVVHKDLGQGRELRGESRVVGRLLGMEAQVLEKQQPAGARAAAAAATSGPTQSPAFATCRSNSSASRAATGSMRSSGTTCPLGRPRCDASTTGSR